MKGALGGCSGLYCAVADGCCSWSEDTRGLGCALVAEFGVIVPALVDSEYDDVDAVLSEDREWVR